MGYDDLNKSSKIGIKGIIKLANDNGFDYELTDNGIRLIDPDGNTRSFTAKATAGSVGKFFGYNEGGMVRKKAAFNKGGYNAPMRPLKGKR